MGQLNEEFKDLVDYGTTRLKDLVSHGRLASLVSLQDLVDHGPTRWLLLGIL